MDLIKISDSKLKNIWSFGELETKFKKVSELGTKINVSCGWEKKDEFFTLKINHFVRGTIFKQTMLTYGRTDSECLEIIYDIFLTQLNKLNDSK